MININLLPKHLRWVREPAHWRLLAVLFPIIAFAVVFLVHTLTVDTVAQLSTDVVIGEDQLAVLAPQTAEHGRLLNRQQQLNSLVGIARELAIDKVHWSAELLDLLSHLPRNAAGELIIEFSSVSVRALNPPQRNPDMYEGRTYYTEFQVSGRALSYEAITEFVRIIEGSEHFGVQFHNASRSGSDEEHSFSLTIVSLGTGGNA